jgi:2,4-dienoyl-CoA reductase-like NADH-dependent reductase (Old Yellow Enzyme family)/NADPH-dependent 2,4-dienoyl-CoA reductase/sulfur reductase-like enzyme
VAKFPHLLAPITVGNTVFRNRIFASPNGYTNTDCRNFPTEEMIAFYELKARGGFASVTVGDCIVDGKTGRIVGYQLPFDDRRCRPMMGRLARAVTRHGAVASVELQHCGMYAHHSAANGDKIYGPVDAVNNQGYLAEMMPEEMIEHIIGCFASAAAFAKEIGYGMVMIHGGHGWLISQFMSPQLNTRRDRWGSTFENRMRFPLAVVEAVRRAVGPGFPIEFRMSGSECRGERGYDIDEGIRIARALDGKVDILHVSAGHHEDEEIYYVTHPSMFMPDGALGEYAAQVKKYVKTPVAAVGAFSDPYQMEEFIASGKADIINMGRGTLAEPDFPAKLLTGREDEVNQCLRCYSCFSAADAVKYFQCALNPVIGLEYETKFDVPPKHRKKVLVAGGGIAGMQAALTAAERGREVILCEKTGRLGGVLNCEASVSFKKKLHLYLKKQALLISRAPVEVRLETEVTPELVRALRPDVIIAALGARPVVPDIPGVGNKNVFSAEQVYINSDLAGRRAVVIGGGLVGAELAVHLAELGREVTVVEMLDRLNYAGARLHGFVLDMKIRELGVRVLTGTKAAEITEKGVVVRSQAGHAESLIEADTVIYAVGVKPEREAAAALRASASDLPAEFYQIGDCLTPKNVLEANQAGYHIARDIGRY